MHGTGWSKPNDPPLTITSAAHHYNRYNGGKSEEIIGRWLIKQADRSSVILATKVCSFPFLFPFFGFHYSLLLLLPNKLID
jgi:hypothetical protein